MARVKGLNGVVFEAHEQIVAGLVDGGHAFWVDADGNEVKERPVAAEAGAEADAAETAPKGAKG